MVALVNLKTFKTFYGPQIGNGHVARATTRDGQPQGMGNHKGGQPQGIAPTRCHVGAILYGCPG